MRLVVLSLVLAFVSFDVAGFCRHHASGVATAQEIATQEIDLPVDGQADKPVKPSATVFVIDCSYSMSRKTERGLGQPRTVTQLEAASGALEALLAELAQAQGPNRPKVGVWLFGHRLSWTPQWKLVRNPHAANGPIPADLAPAEDVELILPLGIFSHRELGAVTARLDRVKPWGQSPVNLAILQALREFGALGGNTSKRIVVITDGPNNQEHRGDAGLRPVRLVSEQDVVAAWKRLDMPIPLFINYLGEPGKTRELEVIVKATGGQLLQSKTEAELIENLRQLSRVE